MAIAIAMKIVTGSEIRSWLRPLADLRIRVFREFPYLYEGSLEYEKNYLAAYANCPTAIAVLLVDGNEVVGASTGLPIDFETSEFREPILRAGFDASQFFYCGESILLPSYRGQGYYKVFFHEREEHARRLRGISHIGFCGVIRESDHPLHPATYQPLDEVWRRFGYQPCPGVIARLRWQDIDKPEESEHQLQFWVKELNTVEQNKSIY